MSQQLGQKVFAGPRIRRLRRDLGLTQTQMATELGISPSYLNLIERNQRPLSAQLLIRLAENYDINLKSLVSEESGRVLAELKEIFSDPVLKGFDIGDQELIDLSGSSPVATSAMISLYRSYRQLSERAEGMTEKFTAGDGQRQQDSTPFAVEQVRDFLSEHQNHIPALEQAAETLWTDAIEDENADDVMGALRRHLRAQHDIEVKIMPVDFMASLLRRLDRHSRRLFISEALPASARTFQIAHQIGLLEHRELFDEIAATSDIESDEGRQLLRNGLANYFAGAVMMPYEAFLRTAERTRYDIDILGRRYSASFEQVCHRLTTLQRAGKKGIPFFFLRVDRAGNISKRFSASTFHFSRYGGTCPRWNIHEAFRVPGRIITQVIEMPDSTTYFALSRTVYGVGGTFHMPAPEFAISLGCEIGYANKLVYSDGHDLSAKDSFTPIGSNCRLCERTECTHRAFPPLNRAMAFDPNRKETVPFTFAE